MDTLKKFGKTFTSVSKNKNLLLLLGSILVSILFAGLKCILNQKKKINKKILIS